MKKTIENINTESNFTPKSIRSIYRQDKTNQIGFWLLGVLLFFMIVLFLPWTQNISSTGHVTTLYQDQRPQQINTVIPGRIVKWYIKEGDIIKKGDTILQLADTKDDYLDSNLVLKTKDQLISKEQKLLFYDAKINAIESQINAIENNRELKINSYENKIEQYKRKLISDSRETSSKTLRMRLA